MLLAGLLGLAGCAEPALQPLAPDAVILAFGDSLTAGVGASRAQSYPQVLQELSGRKVFNAGISGDTTAGGLQRLPATLENSNPGLMILLLGGNDILGRHDLTETRENLAAMIEMAQARNVPVVLLGVPELRLFSSVTPLYNELAEQYEVVYADALLAGLLRNPRYKSDPIHLNAEGYSALAVGIYELLIASGAL